MTRSGRMLVGHENELCTKVSSKSNTKQILSPFSVLSYRDAIHCPLHAHSPLSCESLVVARVDLLVEWAAFPKEWWLASLLVDVAPLQMDLNCHEWQVVWESSFALLTCCCCDLQ